MPKLFKRGLGFFLILLPIVLYFGILAYNFGWVFWAVIACLSLPALCIFAGMKLVESSFS